MKRRLTYFAAVALLADALVLGAAWQTGPALVLTAALAVPRVEPLVAALYAEPLCEEVRIDVAEASLRGALYRPARPRSALVLVDDARASERRDADLAVVARALARRDIAVLVPDLAPASGRPTRDATALAPAVAYVRMLGVPVRVVALRSLLPGAGSRTSAAERAREMWQLFHQVSALLAAR
jgi:hypothetical protein